MGENHIYEKIMKHLSKPDSNDMDDCQIRRTAESRLAESDIVSLDLKGLTQEEIIHELRVHQIELELQNEGLRKAHLDLEESRDRYRDLYDFSPIGYITLTEEALISEVNLTGATMLGIVRQDLIHARFRRFVSPKEHDRWDHFFLSVLSHKEPITCELQLIRKDGSGFSALIRGLCVQQTDQSFQVRLVMSDDTLRKEAEEALWQSEEQLRYAIETGEFGTWKLDIRTGNFSCSSRFDAIFGYEPPLSDWTYDTFLAHVIPQDLDLVVQKSKDILIARQKWDFECRIIRKNGEIRWIWVKGTIESNDQNEPMTMSGLIQDITSRKQAEEELKDLYADLENRVKERTHELSEINEILQEEIQQRTRAEKVNVETLSILDAIIESSKDGILVIDAAGSITKWNNQFITIWNIPESIEVQEKISLFDYISGYVKNPEPFINKLQGVYTSLSMEDADVIELNDGRIFEWYSKPQRIRDDIVGRVFSFRDVTSRVRMELQIEKSLKEKETLLKEIHHRVKNNMQVVSSLLFMQARKTEDAEVKGILLESQNRIKSIALVHERMYQSEDFEKIDYNDYIRKFTRHLFESYQVYSTRISLSINKEMVYLPIDKAVPCSLVINELVSNALKHAFPEGRTGTIFIDFQRQEDRYILVFRDDGIGMPQGIDNTHYETFGLELIRGLVGQLNGTIELDRTAGTAYTITFPVS